jgi:hypothetical protein
VPYLLLSFCRSSWSDICITMVVRLGLIVKSIVSVPSPLSALPFTYPSQYLRITLNYVTLSFFLFSFLHCFTHGILQSFLYTADDTWGSLTSQIVARAHTNPTVFPQFTGRHGSYSLELCNQVPVVGGDPHPCVPFFTAGQPLPVTIPSRYLPPSAQAHDSDASFVRQPFISFFSVLLILFGGQSPNPSGQSNVVSVCPGIVVTPPHLPSLRPHQLGSSTPVASRSTRRQGLMGCRTSSSRQAMVECPSPLIQSALTPSCTQRPGES